jgi:GNAT superfamily N-acetyltransferase
VLQSQDKRLSSSRVLVHLESAAIAGYYTLAIGQVSFAELPPNLAKRLPKRDLPVAILAWLGVDERFQGRGLGERILALALRDCWTARRTFPFVAVVLDCLDDATLGFYQRWDFREIPGHPFRMFVSAAELEALVTIGSSRQ